MSVLNQKTLYKIISPTVGDYKIVSSNSSRFTINDEEMAVRKFKQIKNDVEKIPGSFKKCSRIGIISKFDRDNNSRLTTSCIISIFSSFAFSYTYFIIVNSDFYQYKTISFKVDPKCFSFTLATLFLTSCYWYYEQNKLDKKYSPIYSQYQIMYKPSNFNTSI